MPRALRVLCGAIVVVCLIALTMTATASASVADKKLKKCDPKTAAKGIAKALNVAIGAETAADAVKLVDLQPDQVDAYTAALQQAMDASTSSGSSNKAVNVTATCQGKSAADFTYDYADADGTVLSPALQGNAILRKGKWLLDPVNACDSLAHGIGEAVLAAAGACYEALGLEPGPICDLRNPDPACGP